MATLRHLLATQPYVFAPLCYNPLSARLAEEVGFQAVYLGGGSYGATLTWTEAMLTVTDLAEMTHRCCTAVRSTRSVVLASPSYALPDTA